MIERKFVSSKLNEFQVQEYIASTLNKAGHSKIKIKKTPLGEKIIVYTTRPGLVVGRKGENIKRLTVVLKEKFKMENPQIEIADIENPLLDAGAVADKIVFVFERYGTKRFKFTGYNTLSQIIDAGAIGAEIVISGKVPGARSKTWRFQAGHLKKSGDIAQNFMDKAKVTASLKTGIIGVKVTILPPWVRLPDHIEIKGDKEKPEIKVDEIKKVPEDLKEAIEEKKEEKAEDKKETKKEPKKEKVKEKAKEEKNAKKEKKKTKKKTVAKKDKK